MRMIPAGLFPADDPTTIAVQRVVQDWIDLALERAAGHLRRPNDVTLPERADALEVGLAAWLGELPAVERQRVVARVASTLDEPATARRGRLGRLAEIDFRSRDDVGSQLLQVGALDRVRPTERFSDRVRRWAAPGGRVARQHGSGEDGTGGSSTGPRPTKRVPQVQLCLRSLECLADSREPGRDEMAVMGTASDGLSAVRKFEPIRLGKYRAEFDNERREERHDRRDERREDRRDRRDDRHPSRELRGKSDDNETFVRRDFQQPFPLVTFPTVDTDLPFRSFDVMLMLFERDLGPGGAEKALDKLLESGGTSLSSLVYDKLKKYLVESLGMGAGGFSVALTAAILGGMSLAEALAAVAAPAVIAGLVAMAVYAVFAALRKALAIESFELVPATLVLADLHAPIDADFVSETFFAEVAQVAPLASRAARYRIGYEWRVLP